MILPVLNESMSICTCLLANQIAGSAGSIVTPFQAHPTCLVNWVRCSQSESGSIGPIVTPFEAHPTSHTTSLASPASDSNDHPTLIPLYRG